MTTTFVYRCSHCYALLASGSFGDLAAHGNVCEGVKRWWLFSRSPKARYWLEYKADVDRINGKAYRSRLALQAFTEGLDALLQITLGASPAKKERQ